METTSQRSLRVAARIGLALFASVAALGAHAQLFRTYLASYGNDANPCTLQDPCRLLPRALSEVAAAGEIWILDSANYNTGPVTIYKSVSILAIPGQVGSFVAQGGLPALTLQAPGGTVSLRNVAITNNATNPGGHGVSVGDVAAVSIEDSLFVGIPYQAVYALGTTARIHIARTTFRNIGGSAVYAQDGPVVDVTHSHLLSTSGIFAASVAAAVTKVYLADSVVAGSPVSSGALGVSASTAGAVARIYVSRSTVQDVALAMSATASNGGSAAITLTRSTISGNDKNFHIVGSGAVRSLGNNLIVDGPVADFGTPSGLTPR